METKTIFKIPRKAIFLLLFFFMVCANFFGQSNYRTRFTDGADYEWTTATNWERETSPGVWATATRYPGQDLNNASTVTIRNKTGGEYRIGSNIPNAIGNLVVGVSGSNSAVLTFRAANGNGITISGNVTIGDGAFDVSNQSGGRTYSLTIGGNLTLASGTTFDMTDSDDECDVTFNGTAHTISGSGNYTFRDITFSNTGIVTVTDDIDDIVGTMTINANSIVNPSASSEFNSSGSDGDIEGTGKLYVTIAATNSLDDQYQFDNFDLDSMTVDYSSAGNQNINSENAVGDYGKLITSGSGLKTLNDDITVIGNIEIGSGTTLVPTNNTISIRGNWINNGSFTQASSSVDFEGTVAQSLTGSTITTFNNVRINKSSNLVTLSNDAIVNGTLTLVSGSLDLSNRNLRLGANAVSGTFSATRMIIASNGGELRRSYTGTGTYTFPIGEVTGTTQYSPVTINVTSGSFSSAYIGVSLVDTKHVDNVSPTNFLTRFWKVTQSGITGALATVTGTFITTFGSDVNGTLGSIKAAQLIGTFNQATNPWIKFAVLSGSNLITAGASLSSTQPSFFTGITAADPTVSISGSGVVCAGNATQLTATATGDPTVTYLWSDGLGTNSTTSSFTASAGVYNYSVTVTDGNGITASDVVGVSFLANPTYGSITPATTVCENSQATIALSGLLPNFTSIITYTIANGLPQTINVAADNLGDGSFLLNVALSNDGQVLEITKVERSVGLVCALNINTNNTITLGVNQNVTYYEDTDEDGFGNFDAQHASCFGAPTISGHLAVLDSTDCDDTNNLVYPGAFDTCYDGLDNDCNGIIDNACTPIVTVVSASQCGQTLAQIDSYVYADLVPGAQGYRFDVKNLATNVTYPSLDRILRVFRITQLPSYAFDTDYEVKVSVRINNVWQPFQGEACTVTTPATTTQLTNCPTQIITSLTNVIYANAIPFASGYRFTVTNVLNPLDTQQIVRNLREFRMDLLTGIQYNSSYNVTVEVRNTDGLSFLPAGSSCTVNTPVFPASFLQDPQCDDYEVPNFETPIYAEPITGAQGYRFRLIKGAYSQEQDRLLRSFSLTNFTGITPGTYLVRVAVQIGGVWGSFTGKDCTIVVPGIPSREVAPDTLSKVNFEAVGYPNPFASNFSIYVKTKNLELFSIKVYDMVGRLIEQRQHKADDVEDVSIGDEYPSGVYNIIISQGETTEAIRMIKR